MADVLVDHAFMKHKKRFSAFKHYVQMSSSSMSENVAQKMYCVSVDIAHPFRMRVATNN